jgi:hypothetical protein
LELRDFIVTPIVILLVFITALIVRPYFTDEITRRYWMPALVLRVVGALALGFVYQFYYDGGDTYNFHTIGSRVIWEAFMDDPESGMRLFFRDSDTTGLYKYYSKIYFYFDSSSFVIIRLATIIDLFTFSSYSATAVIFSIFSFVGSWLFFQTFYQMYPHLHKQIAIASFFIPSVFFWGSGLLKDTVALSCLGIATYEVYRIFIRKSFSIKNTLLLLIVCYGLYSIKIYILLAFLPAAVVWVFMENYNAINSVVLKIVFFPTVLVISITIAYLVLVKAGADDPRYSLDNIVKTSQVTAYDIRFYSGRGAGSGYELGELDGSWETMLTYAPQAINVTLFRPYLWEVRNPLMFFSALESTLLIVITFVVLFKARQYTIPLLTQPTILFCMVFSIVFAFSVGISTFNFGTLNRYKIPLLPFYLLGLVLISNFSNNERKKSVLETTE